MLPFNPPFVSRTAVKEVVFCGRSNTGKSSLLRALYGFKTTVGRRPGVTLRPRTFSVGDLRVTDLPGFGFISGKGDDRGEAVRTGVVRYLEERGESIACAVVVVDAGSFSEVVDRWTSRGEIPIELELYEFLQELEIPVIVAVNKMDKIPTIEIDPVLDGVGERLGLLPPWRQWLDIIVPVSAKRGDVQQLKQALRRTLEV